MSYELVKKNFYNYLSKGKSKVEKDLEYDYYIKEINANLH